MSRCRRPTGGPEKWNNAANEATSWGVLALIPTIIWSLAPTWNALKRLSEKSGAKNEVPAASKKSIERLLISVGIVAGVELVAGYFGYKKAETAECDYTNAMTKINDLTLENEKLKVDKKWSDREAERRAETPPTPGR